MEIDLKGNVIFLICYEVVIKGAGQNTSCLSEKSSQVRRHKTNILGKNNSLKENIWHEG